ncbi:MAG: hypothetical protein FWE41_01355 [Coriobacteriia bacterium]|nr:hypothetical protein [Coriobacteriia bacterium]MCL2749998.1 hypothetical protein [Coriobacteriia bacterium]
MMLGRHPLHQAADRLKRAFRQLDFELIDNGEGLEIESFDLTYATWAEPGELFDWQSSPLKLRHGYSVLRTRILPVRLKSVASLAQATGSRFLAFGRVYKDDEQQPMHFQIEGLVLNESQTLEEFQALWQKLACQLFGADADAQVVPLNEQSHHISIIDKQENKTYSLGYAGPASAQALKACGAEDGYGWVFVINVDQYALQYFSLEEISQFYANDLALLSQFTNEEASDGDSPAHKAIDALRAMGYQETCGAVLYEDEAYRKMNMIQEAWDRNNQGYPLVKPLGALTAPRTVLTPALEETLGFNYKQGATDVKVFEVGHIYLPQDTEILPKEHFAVSMGAYGPDMTIESFKKEVEAFLGAMGIGRLKYIPTGMATAYKWNECLIVMSAGQYLHCNFGRIHELAAENYGIGCPAYMANFELTALANARTNK